MQHQNALLLSHKSRVGGNGQGLQYLFQEAMISLQDNYELIICTSTVSIIYFTVIIHDWTLPTYLLTGGRLKYGQQLAKMEACKPKSPTYVPAALLDITTPLVSKLWETELASHPDQHFAAYVLNGIKYGFRVGYDRTHTLSSGTGNLVSAQEHPQVVSDYLEQEKLLNQVVVIPDAELPAINCHVSPFWVIPKKSNPGKWRLIVDLSSSLNASVNDSIQKDNCRVSYITVDDIVDRIVQLGGGTLLARADIKQAYRIIPVHPEDCYLLGMRWQGETVVNKALPFGLRSAPLIFTAVADALQWIMEKRGVKDVHHYLDDFITIGPLDSPQCQKNLAGITQTCQDTGTPLEVSKCEGPSTTIRYDAGHPGHGDPPA